MVDPFGREITYLRVSVTDRCDLRCVYCMSEHAQFLPRKDLLSLEELDRLCSAFIERGVKRLRLTGGEPLVRKNLMSLIRSLSRHLQSGALQELTLTTNGTQLAQYASELAACGIKRLNVSLDTLDAGKFHMITRRGDFAKVMHGIETALKTGISIKLNTVALRNFNEGEIPHMIEWAHSMGMDMTLIETMPLGEVDEDRTEHYLPLTVLRRQLEQRHGFSLAESSHRTGGPARYYNVAHTGGRLGFITPMTHNFCESCNRVRISCTGTLYMCLGQDDAADLRAPLRSSESDEALHAAIGEAIARKPKGHDFVIDRWNNQPAVMRTMSVTGG
ncbi:GTP 3',8-cyclase MoaA [Aureimonas fodinaquatilis]|uniref:GTP 3',8-cyclase n=2 Tax=Aureimonas fodinaquatilis TaxID=2565783 RepID=A0A5B0E152_9HYPH|nr:GTP 3',8-cyclase MoaA [Aureimonas fodinaquatilis]